MKNHDANVKNINHIVLNNVLNLIIIFNSKSKINENIKNIVKEFEEKVYIEEQEIKKKLSMNKIKNKDKFISSVANSYNKDFR